MSPGASSQGPKDQSNLVQKIREHLLNNQTKFDAEKIGSPDEEQKAKNATKNAITAIISGDKEGGLAVVNINFSVLPPLAIFRENKTWIITLGHETECQTTEIDYDRLPDITDIKNFDIPKGHVIKIHLNHHLAPEIKIKGTTLKLVFKNSYNIIDNATLILKPPSKLKKPFSVHIPRKTSLLQYKDQETLQEYAILCTGEPTKSIHQYTYPEFTVLESIQGYATRLESDTLTLQIIRNEFVISKPNGIATSQTVSDNKQISGKSMFFAFNHLQAPETINELLRNTSKISQARIDHNILLVWSYLGLGKIQEALGIINRLKESTPDLTLVPAFSALDGLTQLLANRPQKAEQTLTPMTYDTEPYFWHTVAAASRNVFADTEQLNKIADYEEVLFQLPAPLKNRLLYQILLISCLQKNVETLRVFLNHTSKSDDQELRTISQLGQGVIALSNGQEESAKEIFTTLANIDWAPRVQSIAALSLLQDFKDKSPPLSAKEKIAALERLRFCWRGDLLEYQTTLYLVHQLIEAKQYPASLSILRKLIKYFPEQSHKDKLPKLMRRQLIAYFEQSPPPPVFESLSVFQEFGDIAPRNEKGDKIMFSMTQLLAKLDLVDESIGILNNYLATKLKHGENLDERRVYVTLQIASHHQAKKDYTKALEIVQRIPFTPEAAIDDVNIMKADILYNQKKIDQALALLENKPKQQYKKGAIFFQEENWKDAAIAFENALNGPDGLKDSNKGSKAVLSLAICYSLLQQQDKIKTLSANFGSYVSNDRDKNMLKILELSPSPSQNTKEYLAQVEELTNSVKKSLKS